MKFFARATHDGGFDLGSEYNKLHLKKYLRENAGMRFEITSLSPESRKQRGFFEGAVVPLLTYYQEGMDHRNGDDKARVRDWLKIEFNGEFVVINGRSVKVPQSTKGKLQAGLLERVIDWMTDQGYRTEVLNPDEYKHWRDTIFPHGGPDNYIDYLLELKKLS